MLVTLEIDRPISSAHAVNNNTSPKHIILKVHVRMYVHICAFEACYMQLYIYEKYVCCIVTTLIMPYIPSCLTSGLPSLRHN